MPDVIIVKLIKTTVPLIGEDLRKGAVNFVRVEIDLTGISSEKHAALQHKLGDMLHYTFPNAEGIPVSATAVINGIKLLMPLDEARVDMLPNILTPEALGLTGYEIKLQVNGELTDISHLPAKAKALFMDSVQAALPPRAQAAIVYEKTNAGCFKFKMSDGPKFVDFVTTNEFKQGEGKDYNFTSFNADGSPADGLPADGFFIIKVLKDSQAFEAKLNEAGIRQGIITHHDHRITGSGSGPTR